MRLVILTGTHPRHSFMAHALAESNSLTGLVIEQRENHLPKPPAGIRPSTKALFERHFTERAQAEYRFFGNLPHEGLSNIEILKVSRQDLNGASVSDFLDRHKPDLVLSYGIHKLSGEILANIREKGGSAWNIHGGLSPWYRGVTTHFWPSYLLEPQMTGMTVHETTDALDGGAVIHQTASTLTPGDGIHDLACRAVLGLAQEIAELMQCAAGPKLKPPTVQSTTGRLWRDADWRPEHLHLIYDFYDNKIVDRWLEGDFAISLPRLIRQF